ncbi:hypothetical protein HDV00_004019 [Rhizophlyctis rosea]|nr:hypothetical protein HDV00_004019 [Rhizophlyctis rosea]
MIHTIRAQLEVWEQSDQCHAIVFTNADGAKAFCAGGDVKECIRVAESQGVPAALEFFEEEYKLNHLIGTSKKPIISIMNGITMGGGVGLSVHAPFRIATENTLFAMPETAIGFFPDVGGSFFLSRLDGSLGPFLGLTGHRLKGEEVFLAGIATHFVPASRLKSLLNRLAELETDEIDVVNAAIEEFVGEFGRTAGRNLLAIYKSVAAAGDPSLEKWQNWSLGGEVGAAIDR